MSRGTPDSTAPALFIRQLKKKPRDRLRDLHTSLRGLYFDKCSICIELGNFGFQIVFYVFVNTIKVNKKFIRSAATPGSRAAAWNDLEVV